jgi:acetyl coenzyme A synthetase (ADP forming)-like protein
MSAVLLILIDDGNGETMPDGDLNAFFTPQGVAVIGASHDPEKLGYDLLKNLVEFGYQGRIYPVNRRGGEILGLPVYPQMADVPDPVDLAIIIIPAPFVEEQVIACGERGIKAVTVISSGFRETGPEGAALEESLVRAAKRYGIRLLGPNCVGTLDTHAHFNGTFVTTMPPAGEIAFLSQSGAMTVIAYEWAAGSGMGFSRIVSLGNQAVITETDMLEAISLDEHTRVIMLYVEGIANGQAFVEAVPAVTRRRPVVVLKAGRSEGGALAVASHTGALAGSEVALDAVLRRAGVAWAETTAEMVDWARALAWSPLPQGNRVAVLTNAGGPGVLVLDTVERYGLIRAPLTEETRSFLRRRLPPAASVNNPVDLFPGSGPSTFAICLDALLADETVDAVIYLSAPQNWYSALGLAEVVGEAANGPMARGKPILAVLMGIGEEANQVLCEKHVPNFDHPEAAGGALGALWKRRQWLEEDAADEPPVEPTGIDRRVAEAVLLRGEADDSGWLASEGVDALLAAYGIPTPAGGFAPDLERAAQLAGQVGYPVALKVAAPGLTHKTDVGGVALNLSTPDELEAAFRRLVRSVEGAEGAAIQQMVRGEIELIVGMVRDPEFGPLLMVGTGGTYVELFDGVAFDLAPISVRGAQAMLDRTTAGRLLAGYRGAPPADREAVVETIRRLAQVALDWPQIAEIEINPLKVLAAGEGVSAVDARVRIEPQLPGFTG